MPPEQLEEVRAWLENLSPFAWRFRYPGDELAPDVEEAHKAIELAGEALDFVLRRVPEETQPGRIEENS